MSLERHETHTVVDSTKLSAYQLCPRKCFWQFVAGWVPEDTIHNLSFGRAVHKALETLYDHYKKDKIYTDAAIVRAFADFLEDYRQDFSEQTDEIFHPKDPESFLLLLEQYVSHYKRLDKENGLEILYTEISGSVPLSAEEDKLLHFRLDTVVKNTFGYHILEHKTSSWRTDLWATSFDLSMQAGMGNYVMKCLYGDEANGMVYNGLFFRKKLKRSGVQSHEFLRYPVRLSPPDLNRWLLHANHYYDNYIKDLKLCYAEAEEGVSLMQSFPINPTGCMAYNKVCEYHDFCVGCVNPLNICGEAPEGFKSKYWDPQDDDKTKSTDVGVVR